jgi:hypothetical protein
VVIRAGNAIGQEEVLAEFSDGVTVLSVLEQAGQHEITLRIGSYRTARGTNIKEKVWILKHTSDQEWRVARKA